MRKELFNLLRDRFRNDYSRYFDSVKLNQKEYKLVINNNISIISFQTLRYGYSSKDSFLVSYSLTIYNDEIFKIKKEAKTNELDFNLIYFSKDIYILPDNISREARYSVNETQNKEVVIDNILSDFQSYVFPLIFGLTKDYNIGAELYKRDIHTLKNIQDIFATGIIMAYLNGDINWIQNFLIPKMESYSSHNAKGFFDYYKSKNPIDEILTPLQKIMEGR